MALNYVLIGAVLFTGFMMMLLFMYFVFKIITKENGILDLGQNSFYLNLDSGIVGSYRSIDEHESSGLCDVHYSPVNNPFMDCIDRNIPIGAVTETVMTNDNSPGVQRSGYKIVKCNNRGEAKLLEKINITIDKKTAILSKKLAQQTVIANTEQAEKMQYKKSLDEAMSKEQDRKRRNNAPYDPFNRFSGYDGWDG